MLLNMKPNQEQENARILLAFIAVCFFWGTTYLAIRIGVRDFPPALFSGFRFLIAGIIMLGFALYKKMDFPTNLKDLKRISLVGLLLLCGGNGLVVWAEQWLHSGTVSLVIATVPLFIALIEIAMPNRVNISLRGWSGLLIGFSGVLLLIYTDFSTTSFDLKGFAGVITAALMWSIGSIYSKTFKPSGSLSTQIGIQMAAGGLAMTIFGLFSGQITGLSLTRAAVGSLVYLIIFGSIVGYGCYIYVLQYWPAAKAGTYAYINPLVAVLLGALLLNEPITIFTILSGTLILTGVFFVQTSKITKENFITSEADHNI